MNFEELFTLHFAFGGLAETWFGGGVPLDGEVPAEEMAFSRILDMPIAAQVMDAVVSTLKGAAARVCDDGGDRPAITVSP